MLKNSDIEFLSRYPKLKINNEKTLIEGFIHFDATYDDTKKTESFTLIYPEDKNNKYSGIRYSGKFNIKIVLDKDLKSFPKLFILDDLPKEARRHFYTNQEDLRACVCGPVEEIIFMEDFSLKRYVEELVIPFLYGQTYFDDNEKWPWIDYGHDLVGILESYYKNDSYKYISQILDKMKLYKKHWEILESILYDKNKLPKGHMCCFCNKQDQIRRCHPVAWEGLKKIHEDIHKSIN